MNDFNSQKIKFSLLPTSHVPLAHISDINSIYLKWKSLWGEMRQSLGVPGELPSDGFTRQDLVGALIRDEAVFGLCTFRWIDARHQSTWDDSYFTHWPKECIDRLRSSQKNIIVCGNFCVDTSFRAGHQGIPAKDLLMGMVVQTLVNSQAGSLIGSVRNNRKMNETCYRWGAQSVAKDQDSGYGDAKVDLIEFKAETAGQTAPRDLQQLTENLWLTRNSSPHAWPSFKNHSSAENQPLKIAS